MYRVIEGHVMWAMTALENVVFLHRIETIVDSGRVSNEKPFKKKRKNKETDTGIDTKHEIKYAKKVCNHRC